MITDCYFNFHSSLWGLYIISSFRVSIQTFDKQSNIFLVSFSNFVLLLSQVDQSKVLRLPCWSYTHFLKSKARCWKCCWIDDTPNDGMHGNFPKIMLGLSYISSASWLLQLLNFSKENPFFIPVISWQQNQATTNKCSYIIINYNIFVNLVNAVNASNSTSCCHHRHPLNESTFSVSKVQFVLMLI